MTFPLSQDNAEERRGQIAAFFKIHRLKLGLSVETVARDLGLQSADLLMAYENGSEAIPLDEIFSLTNLLNIPPEDLLALIADVHGQGSASSL